MSRPPFSQELAGIGSRLSLPGGSPVISVIPDAQFASESTTGVSRRKPVGWIPPTPYTFLYKRYTRAFGECKFTHYLGSSIQYTGVVGGTPGRFNSLNHFDNIVIEDGIYDVNLEQQALVAARVKLKRADVNLGIAFAERNQTARLLGDTATRLARSFTDLKHGNVRQAMRTLGLNSKAKEPRGSNAPQKWLELQYGWKPLLSDVYGASEALEEAPDADWRVTAKSRKSSNKIWTKTFLLEESGDGRAEVERSNFTRLDALPGNELLGSLTSLGITNPLLIAWELVPWSFVVDWVLPVGTWLESLDSLLGYESAYYSSSTFTKCEWIVLGTNTSAPLWGSVVNSYTERKKLVKLVRTASNSVPLPTFPRIKDPRSLGHMANGLALLVSAFR